MVALSSVAPGWSQAPLQPAPQTAAITPRAAIKSWGYQLSNIEPDEIAASSYDAVVIDYARDGTQKTQLTAREIERMKIKPDGGRRIVLAYLSVGEAEQYRAYWNKRWNWWWGWYRVFFGPKWLGHENPEWHGNFSVRYWNADWQSLICGPGDSYLGRIVAAGFDGVWLDKVDASTEPIAREIKAPEAEMVKLVGRIAARARADQPQFLIIPQNGEHLLDDPQYLALIDGLGAESLLYGDPHEKKPTAPETQRKRIPPLQVLVATGKPVMAVEYLDDPAVIAAARARLLQLGFTPHFADRGLEALRLDTLPAPAMRPTKP